MATPVLTQVVAISSPPTSPSHPYIFKRAHCELEPSRLQDAQSNEPTFLAELTTELRDHETTLRLPETLDHYALNVTCVDEVKAHATVELSALPDFKARFTVRYARLRSELALKPPQARLDWQDRELKRLSDAVYSRVARDQQLLALIKLMESMCPLSACQRVAKPGQNSSTPRRPSSSSTLCRPPFGRSTVQVRDVSLRAARR
jgi:hypothetical protein